MTSVSPVKDFYYKKNILVTGVTGFLGKALVEKLLRCCDVGNIYLLIRNKYGRSLSQRLDQLTNNLVFERLKKEKGTDPFSRLVPISGDINQPELGLSLKDRTTLIENVDIVFHSAATLDFAQSLKDVVNANLYGTRLLVKLCGQMKNLECLVYVSSAYVNSNRDRADEVLYPQHLNAEELIALSDQLREDNSKEIMIKALKDHPNSYTISKALAEFEVSKFSSKFPTTIVRPSMIVGSWQEPVPGWTDSKNGPQGFFLGAAMGVVRRLPMNKNLVNDYIPVDIVVNELIVAGWKAATTRPSETLVFHCTSSTKRPFRWSCVDEDNKLNSLLHEYPVKSAVWYPTLKMIPNFTLFRIASLFVHFLPAIFFDMMLKLSGGKPRLVQLHSKIDSSLCLLAPFIFKEWFFTSKNTDKLHDCLSIEDKKTFTLDIMPINYEEYFTNAMLGARRYLNKEELTTLPAAKKKMQMFRVFNIVVQLLAFSFVWWIVATVFNCSMMSVFWTVPISYGLFCLI